METFIEMAKPWREAGWQDTLPLPRKSKYAPPAGFTGRNAKGVTDEHLRAWGSRRGNIALRMPSNAMGLDVDAYDGKCGKETLEALESKLGKLPKTWRITSRNDDISGIYLFRNVSHNQLVGIAGPGIEIIQPHHRYAVAPGSVHPSGRRYRLISPEGKNTAEIPSVRQLPRLPRKWVTYLTEEADKTSSKPAIKKADFSWKVEGLGDDKLPVSMENALKRFQDRIQAGHSRYDAVLKATYNIAMLAAEGVSGAAEASAMLEELYVSSVLDTRTETQARREFHRMLRG